MFLGACTFIIACLISCQCPTRHLAQAFTPGEIDLAATVAIVARHWAPSAPWKRSGRQLVAPLIGGFGSRTVRGVALLVALLVCFARSLRCIVCLPGLPPLCLLWVVSALAGFIHHLVKGTLFWFVCCASRGHRFALGTGGLKQSLLVGGIGPVYSLPKYCFKPFRRLSAVGFVLGWHREPHLITTLQAPFSIGYCRTHGGNHRGWTSCGDR